VDPNGYESNDDDEAIAEAMRKEEDKRRREEMEKIEARVKAQIEQRARELSDPHSAFDNLYRGLSPTGISDADMSRAAADIIGDILDEKEAQPWYQEFVDLYGGKSGLRVVLSEEKLNEAIDGFRILKAAYKKADRGDLKDLMEKRFNVRLEDIANDSTNASGSRNKYFKSKGDLIKDFLQVVGLEHEKVHWALFQQLHSDYGAMFKDIAYGPGSGRMWAANEVIAYQVSIDRATELRNLLYP